MTSKEQLLSLNKEIAAWWTNVIGDSKFDRMMMVLKADAFEGNPSQEQMSGVLKFIASMSSIVIPDAEPTNYAKTGLIHDLDKPRRMVELKETEQPKTKKK